MAQIFALLALFALALVPTIRADLPVHCLRHQVAGEWEFTLTQPSPRRNSCGHKRPDNEKQEPLTLADLDGYDGSSNTPMHVTLSMPNQASTAEDPTGSFTMIYDEGFEVNVEGKSFFAFSKYTLDSTGTNTTDCSGTLTGWWKEGDGLSYGCYTGKKISSTVDDNSAISLVGVANKVREVSDPVLTKMFHHDVVSRLNNGVSALQKSSWEATVYDSMVDKTRSELNRRAGIKRTLDLHKAHLNQHRLRPFDKASEELSFLQKASKTTHGTGFKTPESVDWSNYLDPVVNQGDCGSCFTVATTRMMSARNRITSSDKSLPPFSISFPLQCSEYNQGCNGGYAFLQSKWAQDVGLIPAKCFPYSPEGSCEQVDKDCVLESFAGQSSTLLDTNPFPSHTNSFLSTQAQTGTSFKQASHHRYVGGYYGGSDEEDIRRELAENGPLVVSFEPKDDFMYYSNGIYKSSQGDRIHQEWERVDHAVLLVGYGVSDDGAKYWRLQNSWGPEWGESGFFRIARGVNDSGIESIAVAADVVPSDGIALKQFLEDL